MKSKTKNKEESLKESILNGLKTFWFVRLFNWMIGDKSLCFKCLKRKAEADYNGLCWNCYYKSLRKTK